MNDSANNLALADILRREAATNRLCGSIEWSDLLDEAAATINRLEVERDCARAALEECHKIRNALIESQQPTTGEKP